MADLEHDVALRPDSIFEAGSVSKQFTAAAVLLLAQQGRLSLDDTVRKYFPELPDYGTPLTIRHLLNHTSGLRDWGSVEAIAGWPRTTRAYTQAHVLDILSRQRALNYPPGAEYSYSNSGYNLAAMLVERVSGKPFAAFTREAIFTPLGMSSTSWRDDFRRIVKGRAIAYSENGGTMRQLMPFEDVHGNGGLLTTVGDLLKWNQNFTTATVGGRALVEQQLQQAKLTDGRTIAYAAGLMVLHYKGRNEVSHSGTTAAYNAWLGRYPDQGLSVAVLCNSSAANGTQLGHAVADVFLGEGAGIGSGDPKRGSGQAWNVPQPARSFGGAGHGAIRATNSAATACACAARWMAARGTSGSSLGRLRPPISRRWRESTSSDEAEVTLRVALEHAATGDPPAAGCVDSADADVQGRLQLSLGVVRFLRDPAGKVTGLSVSESRVWDLRFRSVAR